MLITSLILITIQLTQPSKSSNSTSLTKLPNEPTSIVTEGDPYCIAYADDDYEQTNCIECITGYGPYQLDRQNAECRKCNVTIDKCFKCQWTYVQEDKGKSYRKYFCTNCTFGYYPKGASQHFAPYHYGTECIKCPPFCVDCAHGKYCNLCKPDREVFLPSGYEDIQSIRLCRIYFRYKMMYLGVFVFLLVTIGVCVSQLLCVRVDSTRTLFLVSDKAADNFKGIDQLMSPDDDLEVSEGGSDGPGDEFRNSGLAEEEGLAYQRNGRENDF